MCKLFFSKWKLMLIFIEYLGFKYIRDLDNKGNNWNFVYLYNIC